MSQVQVEQKTYQMPPQDGFTVAHFLTVADIERSARYYEKVFGARILSLGDGNAPGYLQLANIWMILNVGGGPTPDKPTVTLSVPDPNHINSFMNFRVADIQALTVGEGCALSDFDDITVRIADVAARLAVLGDRRGDELGSTAFP